MNQLDRTETVVGGREQLETCILELSASTSQQKIAMGCCMM